ncbi:starch synthase [Chromatium okenii]|uniref:glycogen synthase n=1 Tax=Chromatium okenii TaxID=61644 RepID=UPI001905FB84|nr:glycogen synthase [Chromatium okenii]MBK1642440.1 starch synthase [Chromatium okenii]
MPKKPTGSKSAPTTSTRIDPATVPMTSSAVTAPPMETPAVAAAPAKKKTSIKSTAKSKASEPAPEVVEIAPEPVAVIDAAPVAVVEIAPLAAEITPEPVVVIDAAPVEMPEPAPVAAEIVPEPVAVLEVAPVEVVEIAPEPVAVPEPQPEPALPMVIEPAVPPRPSLFIVHITPELAAVAKVGGLGDVVFGLSRELAIRGNHVEIILPKYASMRYDQIFEMQEVYKDLWVPWYDGAIHCTVFFGFVHDRKCFFIEPHSQDNFFNRGSIYGFKDDVLRYAFFSRAAMEFLWKSGKHPDIIHCHDWQTALVPIFLYEFYQAMGMIHPRVCLTIHNFAHQGVTGVEILHATGLHRPERFFDPTRMADNRHPKALNLLKGGIVYANFVTTVSPRYAFETKDQGQGFGLESTLHTHHIKYGGVVNGIDYDVWNPEVDRQIPVRYGIETVEGKYDNKRALRQRLMLSDNDKPIVAFIGRLDPQKGLELVRHAIFYTLERGAQFVLLGSSPDDRINSDFWNLKRMLNDSPDCHLEIGFDEDLSHLIYAGADMMLVPSRFEPCGLTQLIALRYGTIPVVRAIGGLADTVFDKDFSDRPLHVRNGYVFQDYDNPGLESALGRAIACYHHHPDHFRELMKNAMRSDYSWNVPGQDYLNIYDYIRDV